VISREIILPVSKLFQIKSKRQWVLGVCLFLIACSTTEIAPIAPPPTIPSNYIAVPHPKTYQLGEIQKLFLEKEAPKLDSLKDCEKPLSDLRKATPQNEEIKIGALELVKKDPELYHWCFYSKILEINEGLRSHEFIQQRQDFVIERYKFLTPIARAYFVQYNDSRYLRWAVIRYREISQSVFFTKVEPTESLTAELASTPEELGARGDAIPIDADRSVLEKYGIKLPDKAVFAKQTPTFSPKPISESLPDPDPEKLVTTKEEPERKPASSQNFDKIEDLFENIDND
jgi:hypothetical protein